MSPRSRIIKKTEVVTNHVKCKDLLRATTLGRSKAISTSKMRKITLIKKNDVKIIDISTDDGDLEDVFLRLIKN